MKMKYVIIIIAVILLLSIGFFVYENYSNQNTIKVDNAIFAMPEGFHFAGDAKDLTITDGSSSIGFLSHDGKNLTKHVNEYIKLKKKDNFSTHIENFTVNDVFVSKSNVVGDNKTVHYWFVVKDKVYEIFTRDANSNTENIIKDIISSVKYS